MPTSALLSRVSIPGSLLLALSLLAGCGGKVLVDGQGVGGAGGAGGATATSGSTVIAATGTGGVSTGPATGTSVTGSGAGGTMVTTSTTVGAGGASTGPTTSSVTSTSSGMTDPVPQVFCNNQPCDDGDICCFNLTMPSDHCGMADVPCGDGYIELSCNGPEDCPNSQICCAQTTQGAQVPYTGIACADSCEGMGTRVVCGDAGDAVCPAGTTCKNSMVLGQGYKVCRP